MCKRIVLWLLKEIGCMRESPSSLYVLQFEHCHELYQ